MPRPGGGRGRTPKVTHAEARAAYYRILQQIFDVPAVLRGRKPVTELAGLVPLSGYVATVVAGVWVGILMQNQFGRVASSMYLRDRGVFIRNLAQQAGISIVNTCVMSTKTWFRVRLTYAWQQQLQDKLHATYFAESIFYRQSMRQGGKAIGDPGQRMTQDIQQLVMELRIFCTQLFNGSIDCVVAVYRIWTLLPQQRYVIPVVVAWSFFNLRIRELASPALSRGILMAKSSRVNGAFRDAHSKLAQHAESVISFGGVQAEAQRLSHCLDESLGVSRSLIWMHVKEMATMQVIGMVISQTLTSCMIHLPMLKPTHHLKALPGASEAARMQANAALLKEMAFNGQLIRKLQSEIGHVSRLDRQLMQMAGNALRVADLLDLRDLAAQGQATVEGSLGSDVSTGGEGSLYFREVDVETPTGVRLVDALSFTVVRGESLVICGANGVGKTSICRTLKGLWPVGGADLATARPQQHSFPADSTVFVPQSPYLPRVSLLEQLNYGHRGAAGSSAPPPPPSEGELYRILSEVNLSHLLDAPTNSGGDSGNDSGATATRLWVDSEVDWNARLSLGEKQQLAVARLLWQRPHFAVLDEATSAVDPAMEVALYEKLRAHGMTLVTVTHRAALLPFHTQLLQIQSSGAKASSASDASGGRQWSLKSVEAGDEQAFSSPRLLRSTSAAAAAAAATSRTVPASPDLQPTPTNSPSSFTTPAKQIAGGGRAQGRGSTTPQAQAQAGSQAQQQQQVRRAVKPIPAMSDVNKTWMLFQLCLQYGPEGGTLSLLGDETVLWMLVYIGLMAVGVWVQTGFLSNTVGALQALTMQSDYRAYVLATLKFGGLRVCSLVISVCQMWLRSGISLRWRERLTRAITARYLRGNHFYVMKHVDRRITDVDTRLTQELTNLVQSLSMTISMVLRPLFDAAYCTVLLLRVQLPTAGIIAMFAYGIGGVGLIRLLAPDFRHFTSDTERRVAAFRQAHERVESHAEAIAFQGGGAVEEAQVNKASDAVMALLHMQNTHTQLWSVVNSFVMHKLPFYIQRCLQFLWSTGEGTDSAVLANRGGVQMAETSAFIGSIVQRSFSALSSLLSLWGGSGGGRGNGGRSGFAGLLGSSRRVADVLLVLEDIERDVDAQATRRAASVLLPTPRRGERLCLSEATITTPGAHVTEATPGAVDAGAADGGELPGSPRAQAQAQPRVLVSGLTFSLECGDDGGGGGGGQQGGGGAAMRALLITGPNGVGKSAIVRVLSGLWFPAHGYVVRPSPGVLGVIPQVPLVPTKPISLLSMLTYPDELDPRLSPDSAAATTAVLLPLMQALQVAYLIERHEGGWSAVKPWDSVLSMGEQQCLGMIRLLYHHHQGGKHGRKPSMRLAILDDATSAMSEDIATECYSLLQARGIRYVSVSQQAAATLRPFHSHELRLGEVATESGAAAPSSSAQAAAASEGGGGSPCGTPGHVLSRIDQEGGESGQSLLVDHRQGGEIESIEELTLG